MINQYKTYDELFNFNLRYGNTKKINLNTQLFFMDAMAVIHVYDLCGSAPVMYETVKKFQNRQVLKSISLPGLTPQ